MARSANNLSHFSVVRLMAHIRTPLYRNAYALIISSATTSGLGIVYWFLAAHYYPADDVGLNSAAVSTMTFLSGISQLNLVAALVRFIPSAGRATGRLVAYTYLINLVLAAIVGVVFILGLKMWAPSLGFLQASPTYALWFILAIMSWSIFTLQDSALTGLRQALWVPIENTLFGVAKLVLLLIFAALPFQFGIFASWAIPAAVVIVPMNLLIFWRLIPKHVEATAHQATPIAHLAIIRFVAANYLGFIFNMLPTTLMSIVVISQVGASANAHFYLAWTVALSLHLISTNMTASFTVEGATDEAELAAYTRRALFHLARLLVPLTFIVVASAPYILRVFGASYAAEGTALLRLLALSAIPSGVNSLYVGFAQVRHRTIGMIMVPGTICALKLILGYIWLSSYGITGIGMAWLVSQTIVAVILILVEIGPVVFPAIRARG